MSLVRRWFPAQPYVPLGEKFLAGFSAFACIWLLWKLDEAYPGPVEIGILASMGATAVLLFAAPHSALVQPYAILGGHILSAIVGVASHQLAPSPDIAAALAVGLSILLMHLLHCLHPPGGATALFAVIGGDPVWNLGYGYVITPVALNASVILLLGLLINNLGKPRKIYPAPLSAPASPSATPHPSGAIRSTPPPNQGDHTVHDTPLWASASFWKKTAIWVTGGSFVLLMLLTFDTLSKIQPGGQRVPAYSVINRAIDYRMDKASNRYKPVIGGEEPLFGKILSEQEAEELVSLGKKTTQAKNCMNCHTLLGNGAYYAPDLTKSWLDPGWIDAANRESLMLAFLQNPPAHARTYGSGRKMPNLGITEQEARGIVAFLKWMSAIDTNGFPHNFKTLNGESE